MKKILYVDMDGVIVDFESGVKKLSQEKHEGYKGHYQHCPGIFATMKPLQGGLEAMKWLSKHFDTYILSSPGWGNASAWSDKYLWVEKYLPYMKKRLILSSQKQLNQGEFLIDDRTVNGTKEFKGEHIHFGTDKFPDWDTVLEYLRGRV